LAVVNKFSVGHPFFPGYNPTIPARAGFFWLSGRRGLPAPARPSPVSVVLELQHWVVSFFMVFWDTANTPETNLNQMLRAVEVNRNR
jgi:hypothetical protein